jgi:hypothetical protein
MRVEDADIGITSESGSPETTKSKLKGDGALPGIQFVHVSFASSVGLASSLFTCFLRRLASLGGAK